MCGLFALIYDKIKNPPPLCENCDFEKRDVQFHSRKFEFAAYFLKSANCSWVFSKTFHEIGQ